MFLVHLDEVNGSFRACVANRSDKVAVLVVGVMVVMLVVAVGIVVVFVVMFAVVFKVNPAALNLIFVHDLLAPTLYDAHLQPAQAMTQALSKVGAQQHQPYKRLLLFRP